MTIIVENKDPDVDATYEIDIFEVFVMKAERSYSFDVGDVVRAQRDTGFFYVCTQAGRTAAYYPRSWAMRANQPVDDGSVVWLTTHPDDATPPEISSVTWIVPTGITLAAQQETEHAAIITLSGGTANADYDVTARITPTVGQPRDVTITVPVRHT